MQDLSGPKIRTGPLEGGQAVTLYAGPDAAHRRRRRAREQSSVIYTPYEPLIRSAKPGDRLLLDDGRIELQVQERRDGEIVTSWSTADRSDSTRASTLREWRCRPRL